MGPPEASINTQLYWMLGMCVFDETQNVNMPYVAIIKDTVIKLLANGSREEKYDWCEMAAKTIEEVGPREESLRIISAYQPSYH